jgi:hypothetical protein
MPSRKGSKRRSKSEFCDFRFNIGLFRERQSTKTLQEKYEGIKKLVAGKNK